MIDKAKEERRLAKEAEAAKKAQEEEKSTELNALKENKNPNHVE